MAIERLCDLCGAPAMLPGMVDASSHAGAGFGQSMVRFILDEVMPGRRSARLRVELLVTLLDADDGEGNRPADLCVNCARSLVHDYAGRIPHAEIVGRSPVVLLRLADAAEQCAAVLLSRREWSGADDLEAIAHILTSAGLTIEPPDEGGQ